MFYIPLKKFVEIYKFDGDLIKAVIQFVLKVQVNIPQKYQKYEEILQKCILEQRVLFIFDEYDEIELIDKLIVNNLKNNFTAQNGVFNNIILTSRNSKKKIFTNFEKVSLKGVSDIEYIDKYLENYFKKNKELYKMASQQDKKLLNSCRNFMFLKFYAFFWKAKDVFFNVGIRRVTRGKILCVIDKILTKNVEDFLVEENGGNKFEIINFCIETLSYLAYSMGTNGQTWVKSDEYNKILYKQNKPKLYIKIFEDCGIFEHETYNIAENVTLFLGEFSHSFYQYNFFANYICKHRDMEKLKQCFNLCWPGTNISLFICSKIVEIIEDRDPVEDSQTGENDKTISLRFLENYLPYQFIQKNEIFTQHENSYEYAKQLVDCCEEIIYDERYYKEKFLDNEEINKKFKGKERNKIVYDFFDKFFKMDSYAKYLVSKLINERNDENYFLYDLLKEIIYSSDRVNEEEEKINNNNNKKDFKTNLPIFFKMINNFDISEKKKIYNNIYKLFKENDDLDFIIDDIENFAQKNPFKMLIEKQVFTAESLKQFFEDYNIKLSMIQFPENSIEQKNQFFIDFFVIRRLREKENFSLSSLLSQFKESDTTYLVQCLQITTKIAIYLDDLKLMKIVKGCFKKYKMSSDREFTSECFKISCTLKNLEMCKIFLEEFYTKINICQLSDLSDQINQSCLLNYLCENKDGNLVDKILAIKGIDINNKDTRDRKSGETPIMNSINSNQIHIFNALVKKKPDFNARDNNGFTILHLLSKTKHKVLIDEICNNKSYIITNQISLEDNFKFTPLDIMLQLNNNYLIDKLKEKKIITNFETKKSMSFAGNEVTLALDQHDLLSKKKFENLFN